jgi:hypothetical protein
VRSDGPEHGADPAMLIERPSAHAGSARFLGA